MFYLTNLSKELSILPHDLGKNVEHAISQRMTDLEGLIIGEDGYIVSIIEFSQRGDGIVDNETGKVNFKIEYKAITFKPLKNELVKSEVKFTNEHGFYCTIGPIMVFVSKYKMDGYTFDLETNSWKGKRDINIKDIVLIEIIAIKINTTEITCLGKLSDT